MKTLTELFTHFAEIDSVSGEEKLISDTIMNFLEGLGLNPIQDEHNMIYCRIGNKPNPSLYCAHMDTVEPGRGIKIIEGDGFLISEGNTIIGGDNKASMTVILYSVQKLILENKNPNIELLLSVREETDSGIQQFNYKKLESKVGFVFDGGHGNLGWLTKQAPTIEDFKIEIKGKSSHASSPEDGINALQVLLNSKDKLKLGRPDEFTTLNIGLINGGFATNTVPENLRIEGDLRSTKRENFAKAKTEFIEALESSAKAFGAEVVFHWIPYCIGYEMNLDNDNFRKIQSIYKSLNIEIEADNVKGGSDAGFLNSIGIETYCLGDAVIDPHSTNEKIEISKFIKLQEIVENLMSNF
jgi:tripeptide aminopeptidase